MKSDTNRSNLARGISAAALAAALLVSAPAMAQSSSTLRGRVAGAAAGATVSATDLTTGQVFTGRVNPDGSYTIVGLRPSTYRIESAGKPAQQIAVPVGQVVTLDIGTAAAAGEAAGEETTTAGDAGAGAGTDIVVTGRRGQEVRSAVVSTNVSQQQIESLPQNDRNFLNFAALAPGVSVSPSSGSRQVQAGAVSADNINVFIDGLSLKNPVNHGGVAGQNFSRGNPFPQLAVQEFKVDTQNFKAEYEQAGSAIITAVTKTGGTEFHGDGFFEWQPKAFIGRPYFDRPGKANNRQGLNEKPDYDRKQYGGDIGGPIIPNVLHFFGAFEATDQTLPSTNVSLQTTRDVGGVSVPNVPQAIANQYNGSYGQSFKQRLYFGKLTLFASGADTINASAFLRRENNLADYGGTAVPSHGHLLTSNNDQFQGEWNHRGDSFLNELTVAYQKVFNGTPRVADGPEIILSQGPAAGLPVGLNPSTDTQAALGANSFEQNDNQKTWTVKNNVTFFGEKHIVKAGVRLAFNEFSREEDSRSNATYYFSAPSYTSFDASTPFAGSVSTVAVQPAKAKNNQVGLFVQDDWSPDEHWTVNAGIRWDYESQAKNEDFVTPAAVATALRNYPGWKAAGINPEDYISTGKNRKPYWKAFQPRLGVSYDLYGDRDTILFAGAGRYYDRPLFITAGIETIKNYYQSAPTVFFCGGAGQPSCAAVQAANGGALPNNYRAYSAAFKTPDGLRAAVGSLGGDIWLLNNDTKLPYTDQFNFGVRKKFGQIQTSITFSHQRSHNIFKYVRGNRLPNGQYTSQGDKWIEDNFPASGQLAGYSGKLNIGSNDGEAHYTAIYFTAEKPFVTGSNWGFTSTLTVQQAKSNVAQELQGDEFYNGPRVDAYGWNYVAGVEKWRFVGTGIARGPWDTKISVTGTFSSGPSFGNVIFPPNAPENACCYGNFGGVFWPDQIVGYANVDARISKNIKMPWGHNIELSFAAFNLFDSVNRNYSAWDSGSGLNPTKRENGTVGNARSFQAGAKYSF